MTPAELVAEFHRAFHLPIRTSPALPPNDEMRLRLILQEEETHELAEATQAHDLTEIADALADIVYVTYGSALAYGIDLDAVLREVHRSNMDKLPDCERCAGPRCQAHLVQAGTDRSCTRPFGHSGAHVEAPCPDCADTRKGEPLRREDGKVLKPEGWQPPRIAEAMRGAL